MPRALIVDDNQANLYLLQALLTGSGYEVTSASNGAEALDKARRSPFDLVISDILMPMMDGFSLCRAWRQDEALRKIPFIFYTATYTDSQDERFAMSLGADAFIIKPMEPCEFTHAIAEVIEKRHGTAVMGETPPSPPEANFLREYNATLIRKLEDKVIQLDKRHQQLAIMDFAIASAISGIAITNDKGVLTYANRALAELSGYPVMMLVGMDVRRLVEDQDALGEVAGEIAARGHWLGELRGKRRSGTSFPAQAAVHVFKDKAGQAAGLMISCLDLTGQKEIEERLRRVQRLETMGVFAAGIVHDFNNLLGAICCNLDLAEMSLPPASPTRNHLDAIRISCDVANDLLRRLGAFARGELIPKNRIVIADCLRRCARLSLAGSAVTAEMSLGDGLATVGDESQIMQLFSNLLINARQAMPGGGRIEISAGRRALGQGEIGQLAGGSYVEITVGDEGTGIPEDLVSKIFDPYFTTKLEGSGLGLAICFSIVNSHGGHISAASGPGRGARFTILLPEDQAAPAVT